MSNKKLTELSEAERAEYGKRIKAIRQAAGMKQSELAQEAKVSRATISNIENGSTTPQAEILGRILGALGIETSAPEFEPQTELWLSMMGALIESIPELRRAPVVNGAMRVLADGVREGSSEVAAKKDHALAAFDMPTWQQRQEHEHE
ncbi:helix-turn-helix domain-containing protein [Leifsonia aquatica]|uniref:helix-turn-helix domain-containing protein n=1 Tax=Leifsonia aquatica TaxID=144185 RepID=UPI00046920AD|nr:helix-turn-helix transcriptional regulator [Leifsonia aquatica]